MTCIIGIVDGKRVIIGGDSAGVSGLDITERADVKVFRVGKFLIGGAGSFRMIQLLRFYFKPPAIEMDDIYAYMCTEFIETVRRLFTEAGFAEIKDNVSSADGLFLVGYENRLFEIESDFQVGENINGLHAIGCGSSYAMGAMEAMGKKTTAQARVKRGLEIATKYSGGVRPPYIIMST